MPTANSPGWQSDNEERLWKAFLEKCDQAARSTLIEMYLPLSKKIAAKQYKNRIYDDVDFEDFYQYGVVGLIEAIDRYRPGLGATFETYATYRISGSITNNLKRLTERREQSAYRSRVLKQRVESLSGDESQTLLDELIDLAVGLAVCYMLDGTALVQEEDAVHTDTPYKRSVLSELKGKVNLAIGKVLTEKEQLVILYHYGHELTFDIIAETIGVSKGRISQIHKNAMEKLRDEITLDTNEYYA